MFNNIPASTLGRLCHAVRGSWWTVVPQLDSWVRCFKLRFNYFLYDSYKRHCYVPSTLPPSTPPISQTSFHPNTRRSISHQLAMAKSLRSKTKRAFRSKKRESGVYAAAAAGRLHRLNSKLIQTIQKDSDGDVLLEEGDNIPGWCWFATFGLLDPNDITLEGLESLTTGFPNQKLLPRARFLDEDSWWFLFTTFLANRWSLTFIYFTGQGLEDSQENQPGSWPPFGTFYFLYLSWTY